MFYYVKGTLALTEPTFAVVECGGVGYKLTISGTTLSKIAGHLNETVTLYTHLSVREDAFELLGFYSSEELNAFKLLITVSGVGPKAAIAILSIMTPEKFAYSVSVGDAQALAKASGIGGKTAARIILELKDKVAKELNAVDTDTGEVYEAPQDSGKVSEALSALMVLGYTRAEAERALSGVDLGGSLENIITSALKKLASRM